jgi:hypothetical protein
MDIDNNISQKYPLLETFSSGGCRFAICPYRDTANDNNNTHLQELDLGKCLLSCRNLRTELKETLLQLMFSEKRV